MKIRAAGGPGVADTSAAMAVSAAWGRTANSSCSGAAEPQGAPSPAQIPGPSRSYPLQYPRSCFKFSSWQFKYPMISSPRPGLAGPHRSVPSLCCLAFATVCPVTCKRGRGAPPLLARDGCSHGPPNLPVKTCTEL
jgi:hypothetical protein